MEIYTTFEDIYKLFLYLFQDFELKRLFAMDADTGEDLLQTFLFRAIPLFKNCKKDIFDVDETNKCFNCQLDIQEKGILSDLMVLKWMDFIVNDTTQWGGLQDTDFKRESAANNLKEKKNYVDEWREKVEQEMVDYGLRHTPFDEWAVGNFGI